MDYYYEKQNPLTLERERAPMDDKDGSITGHIIIGLSRWFDENPEERKRLGYIKHLTPDTKDIEFNRQTQFLMTTVEQVDDWTITDVYHVRNKSEEMLWFEEMYQTMVGGTGGFVFI